MNDQDLKINYPFFKINSPIKYLKEINNKYIFPISWLHTQQYCECYFYLWLLGHSPKKTEKMIEGEEEHSAREKEFKPAPIKEVIKDTLDEELDYFVFRTNLLSIKEQLLGIQDEIVSIPKEKKIIIVEQKPGFYVFDSDKLQAYGYALAFIDQFSSQLENEWKNFTIEIAIRDRKKFHNSTLLNKNIHPIKFIKHREEINQDHFNLVRNSVFRIDNIIKNKIKPTAPENIKKCKSCSLNNVCIFKKEN
ncbi:MAG: PD-(D/E)XK nuclease family protein [archaeon]